MLRITEVATPVGPVTLVAKDAALCGLIFSDGWPRLRETLVARFGSLTIKEGALGSLADRVRAYIGGDIGALSDIPVDVAGTPFQERVWTALQAIPPGEVISYTELAKRVGAPRAVRAVGTANGQNPVSLVIPCHRVIAKDGTLGGYGGGLDRKRWLLAHEKACLPVEPDRGVADDRPVLVVDRLLVMKQLSLHG